MKAHLATTTLRKVKSFEVVIECEDCGSVRSFKGWRLDETCELIHKEGWHGGKCKACKSSLSHCSTD